MRKVRGVLVVIGWASAVMLLTVRAMYQFNPARSTTGSFLNALDLVVLLAVSVVAGIFLADLNRILFGYVGSMVLSILMAFIYSTLFDWFVTGAGEVFTEIPFGWEYAFFYAFTRILRTMFPSAMLLAFLGGFVGGIINDIVWPHRG